jgi:microcompartment protein CcmL/EutN
MDTYNKQALGMIETKGITALIAAGDAAAKAAQVEVITYQTADAGIVTIFVRGDVSSITAAVAAGSEAAKQVGLLLGSKVIANPAEGIMLMVKQANKKSSRPLTQPASVDASEDLEAALRSLSIHELRRKARETKGFPATGRKLIRKKKEEIIELFIIIQKEGELPL